MRPLLWALTLAGVVANGHGLASTQEPEGDGVRRLLARLEGIAVRGGGDYATLLAESADPARASAFASTELLPGGTRAVIQARDREPLDGTLPGNGYRLLVDVFAEYGARARIATWRLDVKRVGEPGTDTEWLLADQARVTSIENLRKLSLNPAKQFAARDLRIALEDLDLVLADGSVFVADTDEGAAAVVLLGRGEMRFHPAPETEKSQLRIFCGADVVETRFDAAYLRVNPADFDRLVAAQLTATSVDSSAFRRAERVFREESPKSYGLELGDLSRDRWSLSPGPGDVVAEIRTRRFDTLTYTRSSSELEDINLYQRSRRKVIAVYSSPQAAARARASTNEARADYDVLHYDIDVWTAPDRRWIEGRARMTLKVRANAISSLAVRLADSLAVQSIASDLFGRLYGLRIRDQNNIVVGLPATVLRDTELTLTITYAGRLEPQSPTMDALEPAAGRQPQLIVTDAAEPSFLYSNQTNWYPQGPVAQYATAALRISVPAGFDCVATGEADPASPTLQPGAGSLPDRKVYVFTAVQPVRYLAFIVSRFVMAQNGAVSFLPSDEEANGRPGGAPSRPLKLAVAANPHQVGRGREVGSRTIDMAFFYQSLLGECPYPSFTIALIETDLPGGHSPGYFAVLNQPLPSTALRWRNDPASFESYPDFFIAHELAHQWWGQAVGWRNYHEQWLSEGFAQYFAALYAERRRGTDAFASVMRQMRKWAIDESGGGPVSLGYRLGHIRDDSRTFRAIVYDKGALVLHMLRRLVGDDAFFRGLRRFYRDSRFQNVGTAELRSVMEEETGRPLARFFDRWIYGSALPRLKLSSRIDGLELVLRVEQMADIFDVPLTLTLQYTDGTTADVVVPVTERIVDTRLPLAGALRGVTVSRDDGTLAEIIGN